MLPAQQLGDGGHQVVLSVDHLPAGFANRVNVRPMPGGGVHGITIPQVEAAGEAHFHRGPQIIADQTETGVKSAQSAKSAE